MNYESLFGLLGTGCGVGLTLIYQARNAAVKALKEANAAVENADKLSDTVRYQVKVINDQTKAHLEVFQSEMDKRTTRLEVRLEDLNSRVAGLQIKR
jgi:hypothetical protein